VRNLNTIRRPRPKAQPDAGGRFRYRCSGCGSFSQFKTRDVMARPSCARCGRSKWRLWPLFKIGS
jgi:hypothetical protein